MAVERNTIHNLVWQKLVPTYRRDINKFPNIYLKKHFQFIDAMYLEASIYRNEIVQNENLHSKNQSG